MVLNKRNANANANANGNATNSTVRRGRTLGRWQMADRHRH
jgi:hypothetical protein